MEHEYNKAIMYKLRFHPYEFPDYFKDNSYYHTLLSVGCAITFNSLRDDLCSGVLNGMPDEEIADVIATICWNIFDFDEEVSEITDWICDKHEQENQEEKIYFTDGDINMDCSNFDN